MKNKQKIYFIFFTAITLVSCDASLHMTYTVENKSEKEVRLFIPQYPIDSTLSLYGEHIDTVLILKPKDKVVVGIESKIDFPWATKNIYRNKPGKCGIKKMRADTTIAIDCTKKEWKYQKRSSNLKIR